MKSEQPTTEGRGLRDFLRLYPREWRKSRAFRLQMASAGCLLAAGVLRGDVIHLLVVLAVTCAIVGPIAYLWWRVWRRWKG
jgi:Flp pilus assembly protein TadB